ncbi:MAG: hypothetical protein U0521_22350 [Anaerolineae bacterium]
MAARIEDRTFLYLQIGFLASGCLLLHSAITVAYDSQLTQKPENVGLLIGLTLLGFAFLGGGALFRPSSRLRWLVLTALIVETLVSASVWLQNTGTNLDGFASQRSGVENIDSGIYNEIAAHLFLRGENPYTWDFSQSFNILRTSQAASTPVASGSISAQYAYPALTFLLPAPFVALGLPGNFAVTLLAHLGLLVLLFLRAPARFQPLVLLPVFVVDIFEKLSFAGNIDIVWAFFITAMILCWDRSIIRAVLFGLAISYKQNVWLIAPFLLVQLWYEGETPSEFIRRAVRFALIGGGAFGLLNAPFFLANPQAWLHGVFQPMFDNMVYVSDGGLSTLVTAGIATIPKSYFSVATVVILLLLLFLYWRHFSVLRDVVWIMPGIVMWFGYRNLQSYWIYWLFPVLAVLIMQVARPLPTIPRRSWRLSAVITCAALVGLAAGAVVSTTDAVRLELVSPVLNNSRGRMAELSIRVTNNGADVLTPRFFVQKSLGTPLPWRITSGSETLLPGESAVYSIESDRDDTSPMPFEAAALSVLDAGGNYALARTLALDADRSFLWPDAIPNPGFRFWTEDGLSPVYWPLSVAPPEAGSIRMTQVDGRDALALQVAPSDSASSVSVETQIIFPQTEFGVWVYREPNQASGTVLQGIEFTGQQHLLIVFGEEDRRTSLPNGTLVIQRAIPSGVWSYQPIDLVALYEQAGWQLPPLERRVFQHQIDMDLRLITMRVYLTARGIAEPAQFYVASFTQPDLSNLSSHLVEDSLNDPLDYYLRLAEFAQRYRNDNRALEAYQQALTYAPDDDFVASRIAELCQQENLCGN